MRNCGRICLCFLEFWSILHYQRKGPAVTLRRNREELLELTTGGLFKRSLETHSNGQAVVVHGEPGCGKTTFLVSVMNSLRRWFSGSAVVYRFGAMTPPTRISSNLFRSIVLHLSYFMDETAHEQYRKYPSKERLLSMLEKLPADSTFFVIFDAVDQMKELRLGKSSEAASIGPNHFLELLLRVRKSPALLLQKNTKASVESNCNVVVSHVETYLAEGVSFDRGLILEDGWNSAKAKLALAVLYVCVIKFRLTTCSILEVLKKLPNDQQKIVERALSLMTDSEPSNQLFSDLLDCAGPSSTFESPEVVRGIKRKSSSFAGSSPMSTCWDSPQPRVISSLKRRNAKIDTLKTELRTARSENDELLRRIEVLEAEAKFSETQMKSLETTAKTLKADNRNLEALLIQADGKGSENADERLDRVLEQLRQTKDDLKAEIEGRAQAESHESALQEKLDNLQKRIEKASRERDAAISAVEEAQSTIDNAIAAEADLRVQNELLLEELQKLKDELDLFEGESRRSPKRRRRSASPLSPPTVEEEGEDMTCVLEAKIEDLNRELSLAQEELQKVRAEKNDLTTKFEAQAKSGSEKARFIATLTSETKRLKTDLAQQKHVYDSRIANLEMRLAKTTKEKNTETLALQDLRETYDDQLNKIRSLEKDIVKKQKKIDGLQEELKNRAEAAEKMQAEWERVSQENEASGKNSAEVAALNAQLATMQATEAARAQETQSLKSELEVISQHLKESDEVRQQLTAELISANEGFAQAKLQLKDVRDRLTQIEEQTAVDKREAQKKLDELQGKFEEKSAHLEQAVRRLEESDEARQQLLEELRDTSNSYGSIKEQMKDIRSRHGKEREDMQKATFEMKENLERVTLQLSAKDAEISNQVRLVETMKCEAEAMKEQLDELRSSLAEAESQLQTVKRENDEISSKLEAASISLNEEKEAAAEKLEEKCKELDAVRARLEELNSIFEKKQGEGEEERLKLSEELAETKQQVKNTKQMLQSCKERHQKEREQFMKTSYESNKKMDELKRQLEAQIAELEQHVCPSASNVSSIEVGRTEVVEDLKIQATEQLCSRLALENQLLDLQMRFECVQNEKTEAEETLDNLQQTVDEYRGKEEENDREKEKMQAELREVRVQLTNIQVMLQAAQSDRNRHEQEREELVKANFELRQLLDEERMESANLRSNLEAENSDLADQVRSLENSRAEILEELDRSNMNMSVMCPDLDETRLKVQDLQATNERTKQSLLQFAAKFQIDVKKEMMESSNFAAQFMEKLSSLMESVRGEIADSMKENEKLLDEKQQLQKEMADLESKKEAEMLKRENDLKEFTKSRMREVSESLAKDEERWERRLKEKEEKLKNLTNERNEVAEKYNIAKRKIEEIVQKYGGELKNAEEAIRRFTDEKTELQRAKDSAEERCSTMRQTHEREIQLLSTEKAALEASLNLADLRLKESNRKRWDSAVSKSRGGENIYETIPGGFEPDDELPGLARNSNFAHIYANLPMKRATSTSSNATMLCRAISTSSVASRALACEDEEGEILSETPVPDLNISRRLPDASKPEYDAKSRMAEMRMVQPLQMRSNLEISPAGDLEMKELNFSMGEIALNISQAHPTKKPCTKPHRRSRSLSPCAKVCRRPLQSVSINQSTDLDSSCASTSSNNSTGSRRAKKAALQTSYHKPGPPTPGRNCSLNSSGRLGLRKSSLKQAKPANTPNSLQKLLRPGRRSVLSTTVDKENLSVLTNSSIVSNEGLPATKARSKASSKIHIFRNPFSGH